MNPQQSSNAADFRRAINELMARSRIVRDNMQTPASTTTVTPLVASPAATAAASARSTPAPVAAATSPSQSTSPSTPFPLRNYKGIAQSVMQAPLRCPLPPIAHVRPPVMPSSITADAMEREEIELAAASIAKDMNRLIEVIPNRSMRCLELASQAVDEAFPPPPNEAGAPAPQREQLTQLAQLNSQDPRNYYGQASEELSNLTIQLETVERSLSDLNADALDILLDLATWLNPVVLDPALDASARCQNCVRMAKSIGHDSDEE